MHRTAVDAMSERASSASQYALSLENQDGVSLRLSSEDRKLIAMGMTLHESGKQLMSRVRATSPSSAADAAICRCSMGSPSGMWHDMLCCSWYTLSWIINLLGCHRCYHPCLGQMATSPARPGAGRGVLRSL